MSLKQKIEKWFYLEDEEEYEEMKQPTAREQIHAVRQERPVEQARQKVTKPTQQNQQSKQQKPNLVSIESAKKTAEVFLTEPRVYAEAQEIADQLLQKKAVIVNLQRIDREQALRIVDFLSGTVYSLNGDIQRVGTDIFLCTPENVEVGGEITDYIEW
ncbi:cell division protein SepF [Savagea faecisuis]|uniref:Cell division protein SepF n=1 Tax=Savagea faecisuis TaxID=1274803 RepID=A0ABW3GVR6_9BACL